MNADPSASPAIKRRRLAVWAAAVLSAAVLLACGIALRRPAPDAIYVNQDANWHVLHTLHCYNGIPASEHLFLPLVTPNDDARGLAWGATPQGQNGIYYYTSFWPAGFVLPWLFAKASGLGYTPAMLYALNGILLALTLLAVTLWLVRLFGKTLYAPLLVPLAAALYLFQPEIMQGQGAVYWHQSVNQLLLACQLLAFSWYGKRAGKAGFYACSFLLCLFEWTGLVANAGYALLMLLWGVPGEGKPKGRARLARCAGLGGLTAATLGMVLWHYAQRLAPGDLLAALTGSMAVRGDVNYAPLLQYFVLLFRSLRPLWMLAGLLLVAALLVPKARRALPALLREYGPWLAVSAFPMLENAVLRQHALEYSYDRMKAVFPLLCAVCMLLRALAGALAGAWRKLALPVALAGALALGGFALAGYVRLPNYYVLRDDAGYLANNQELANVLAAYPREECLYGFPVPVRGYTNITFGGGALELANPESTLAEAAARDKQYAIFVDTRDGTSSTYRFISATVTRLSTGEEMVFYAGTPP